MVNYICLANKRVHIVVSMVRFNKHGYSMLSIVVYHR